MAARFLIYLALLFGIAGTAQAACTGALPMSCTPGATPVSTDLVLGGQNGQTVKFTIAQLASSGGGGGGGVVTQGTIPWVDSITGTVTVVQPTGSNLHVVCDSGCSGGGGGGGNVNVTQWDTINLGAPSAYGTSPGAVTVPGVNAFVTNPVAVTQTTGTNLHVVCDSGCGTPVTSTAVDHSGSITLGGTAQTLIASNSNRLGCEVQALSSDLWVNVTTTASAGSGSFFIPAGSQYICAQPVSGGTISVFGATTSATYTAVEYTR